MSSIQSIAVFKTNIFSRREALRLKTALLLHFPDCDIHFDLDDCDRVLRIEGTTEIGKIIAIANNAGVKVNELPD